jgi:hypothetical protein
MASGRARLGWAAKARAAAAFCLAGAVGGAGLYFSNLAYVRAGDVAARSAAAARQAAAAQQAVAAQQATASELQVPREPKPTSKLQAVADLAGLLSQSTSDRSALQSAANDVFSCGPLLGADQATFQQVAFARRSLITELTSLGLGRYLPAALVSELTEVWQTSQQADLDYAQWASDEKSKGCTPDSVTDPSYAAAAEPSAQATADKAAFLALWNPIAKKYGLPTYNETQI